MSPFFALTLGVLSRLLPSLLHVFGRNLTAVGASLLFFGARRPLRELPLAALPLILTDILLTTLVFHLAFHPTPYLLTWLWYLAIPVLGHTLLRPHAPAPPHHALALLRTHPGQLFTQTSPPSPLRHRLLPRASLAVLLATGSFFLLSNGSVWLLSGIYPHTAAGLLACYAAGLPFFRNDLLSTAAALAIFFAIPARIPAALPNTGLRQPTIRPR